MNGDRQALGVRAAPRERSGLPWARGPRRVVAALALSIGLVCATGCQCPRLGGVGYASAEGARTEPGAYAEDARVAELLATWPSRVARAIGRLELVTGIDIAGTTPEVLLAPLGDETRALSARAAVVDGVRTPSLVVNLERLAAGVEDADEVLTRGLALAALEVAAARSGAPVPPWLAGAVGAAADGALAERAERLARDDVLAGRPVAARVDPEDARAAESTGVAVLLLLLERGGPDLVRRWLEAALDGDEPAALLRRLLKAVAVPWGEARRALASRLADVDTAPWHALRRAEAALEESGRAGFLAEVGTEPASEVRDELSVLSARAALSEGDVEAARVALRALPDDAARRLRDPRELAVLRVRVEAAPGGDPGAAVERLAELERDYPRTSEADRLRLELRLPEDAHSSLEALRRRARREGLAALDLLSLVRYVDLLHREHRDGEAQRVLDGLGERATAPELGALASAVAQAREAPSPQALAVAAGRVEAWRAAPGERTRADVVESGRAAAVALEAALSTQRGESRAQAVALLGLCEGPQAVRRLLGPWQAEPALVGPDLEALAGAVSLPEVEVWLRAQAEALPTGLDLEATFAALRLDLPAPWAQAHADVVRDLRSPAFAVRRQAVQAVVEAGQSVRAPAFVARLLRDPAPALRREGVRAASAAGFTALLGVALGDPTASVRRAAAQELGRHPSPGALDALLERLARDGSPGVRAAAGLALLETAPRDPRVLPAVLQALADDDAAQRQALLGGLLAQPREALVPAALDLLTQESAEAEPHAPSLAAWFRLLERLSGRDLGYYPGMPPEELRRLLVRVRERLADVPKEPR